MACRQRSWIAATPCSDSWGSLVVDHQRPGLVACAGEALLDAFHQGNVLGEGGLGVMADHVALPVFQMGRREVPVDRYMGAVHGLGPPAPDVDGAPWIALQGEVRPEPPGPELLGVGRGLLVEGIGLGGALPGPGVVLLPQARDPDPVGPGVHHPPRRRPCAPGRSDSTRSSSPPPPSSWPGPGPRCAGRR